MIDWEGNLASYNRDYGTYYATRSEMLKALYASFESATKVGEILHVSNRVVLEAMREDGLEILPKGHRPFSTMEKRLFDLGDVSDLTFSQITRKLGWSREYGHRLLRKHKVNFKRLV